MPEPVTVHKLGLTSATIGTLSVSTLSFVTVSANRLRTGVGAPLVSAVGWPLALALLALWLALAALSIASARSGPLSAARGVLSVVIVLGTFALCSVAAARLLPGAGAFGRVSVGGGVWVSVLAAYAVVLSARRELGMGRPGSVLLMAAIPVGIAAMLVAGVFSNLGMVKEYANISASFWVYVRNTAVYAIAALGAATVIGFILGALAFVASRFKGLIFGVVSVFQTIPGLAMIGLLFAPLAWVRRVVPFAAGAGVGGLGWAPVVVALTLYALLAITRNTYAGLASVPDAITDAGRGMGMSRTYLMWRVRVPLALPVLFSGERTAAVQTVGNSTLGAFVAAFTLGTIIFGGLSQQALDLTMLGSVALVILAIVFDGVLRGVQRALTTRERTPQQSEYGAPS